MRIRTGIGQDSHRFENNDSKKLCIVAGLVFKDAPGLDADSDGDVVFHAICNAISSVTGVPILGGIAITLCREQGIKDSEVFLKEAMKTLGKQKIDHVALTIEGQRPKFQKRSEEMSSHTAKVLGLDISQVGITFTSGDGMTAFGRGEGLQCFCIITTIEK